MNIDLEDNEAMSTLSPSVSRAMSKARYNNMEINSSSKAVIKAIFDCNRQIKTTPCRLAPTLSATGP